MIGRRIAVLSFVVASSACSSDRAPAPSTAPLRAPRQVADETRFRLVPATESGIDFSNRLAPPHVLPYLYNGAGVTVGDYDDDGLADVYFVSQDGPNRLFRQTAPLRFADVTAAAGVDGGEAWGSGAAFVDVDGDGRLDLYVCNTHAPNLLYRNRGDGTFEEVAERFGVAHVGASTVPAFADYDRDGDADLYLVTNRVFGPTLDPSLIASVKPPSGTATPLGEMAPQPPQLRPDANGDYTIPPAWRDFYFAMGSHVYAAGQRDRLFRNDGDRFTDVTMTAGIADQGMGLSATWWDVDDDGWLDLYVANDLESPDQLYRNRGDGTFEDVGKERLPHLAYFGMGSDSADLDRDGRLDLMVADMSMTTHYKGKMVMGEMDRRRWFLENARPPQIMRNAVFLNTGTPRFMEIAYLAGIASTDWTWATLFGDLDGDGWEDLFVTNGIPRFDNNPDLQPRISALWRAGRRDEAYGLIRNVPPVPERNLAFRNDGDLHFTNVAADWGLDALGVSQGAVLADLDRDGDLDVVVNNLNATASVYENLSTGHHALLVRLVGNASHRFGLGARVTVETDDGARQTRLLTSSRGFLSGAEPLAHFGLGTAERVTRLHVDWPSGASSTREDVAAGQLLVVVEPDEADSSPTENATADTPSANTLFEPIASRIGLDLTHVENAFDDFAVQPLLPHRLSRFGPGLAWGDADGDGAEDLWIGGAGGSPGRVLLRAADGTFAPLDGPWSVDAAAEDLGAVWFDLDGDGDDDLYVVSGGNAAASGDPVLADRVYRNDGTGRFSRDDSAIVADPKTSGGGVTAADWDRDGDVDLVVLGRVTHGGFPAAPPTRLLQNEDGALHDRTARFAPELGPVGLATAALWTDVDADGWLDLVVTTRWGSVRLFRNLDGKRLVDATDHAGFADHTGLWNGVGAADLDGDGDFDLVTTNLGLNTKYKATAAKPLRIYCRDFDDNGVLDVVEAKYEGDRLLPVRGRSCSSNAMPFLAQRFPTFDRFARSTLDEIYGESALDEAVRLEVRELRHVWWTNDGRGVFTPRPLPHLAQAAPAFGIATADFDVDGDIDVVLAQNFFANEPETGRMAGSLSLLLRNHGDGSFETWRADRSGISIAEAATAATVCDLDGDAAPDLCIATNDGPLYALRNRTPATDAARMRLPTSPQDVTVAGAVVTIETTSGDTRTIEIATSSGYLQGASRTIFLGREVREARVRWPSGRETSWRPSSR